MSAAAEGFAADALTGDTVTGNGSAIAGGSVVDDVAGAEDHGPTRPGRRDDAILIVAEPVLALAITIGTLVWAFVLHGGRSAYSASLTAHTLLLRTVQHVEITAVVVAIGALAGVPLGIAVTRRALRPVAPGIIAVSYLALVTPSIGVLVLAFLFTERIGFWVGVLPLAFYAMLPVLHTTARGIRAVDPQLVDAARGQGMSDAAILRLIEFPLAVPSILSGVRTALVMAVGTATLCFLVGAGGLGVLIDTGFKLRDARALYVGCMLTVALALGIDWLAALAERYLGPRGGVR